VSLRRYHGEAPRARPGGPAPGPARSDAGRRRDSLLLALLFAAGVALLAFLAWNGRDYYPLDRLARIRDPRHAALRSAGPVGHGIGIAATAFLLSNFLYAARKRLASLAGAGRIRTWLHVHVFVGFMAPAVIAFHAAFQSRNLLASGTTVALAVVVATGLVGRFAYGVVHSARPGSGIGDRRTLRLKAFLVVAIALHIAVSLYLGFGLFR
jgi:hypothetical protein